jgi:hypothetical protein
MFTDVIVASASWGRPKFSLFTEAEVKISDPTVTATIPASSPNIKNSCEGLLKQLDGAILALTKNETKNSPAFDRSAIESCVDEDSDEEDIMIDFNKSSARIAASSKVNIGSDAGVGSTQVVALQRHESVKAVPAAVFPSSPAIREAVTKSPSVCSSTGKDPQVVTTETGFLVMLSSSDDESDAEAEDPDITLTSASRDEDVDIMFHPALRTDGNDKNDCGGDAQGRNEMVASGGLADIGQVAAGPAETSFQLNDSQRHGQLTSDSELDIAAFGFNNSLHSSRHNSSDNTAQEEDNCDKTVGTTSSMDASATQDMDYCVVCLGLDSDPGDEIVYCEGFCNQVVHWKCFGMSCLPKSDFYCDVCSKIRMQLRCGSASGSNNPILRNPKFMEQDDFKCYLCQQLGGLMRLASCGRLVHPCCVLYCSELTVDEVSMRANNLNRLDPERRSLRCVICKNGCKNENGAENDHNKCGGIVQCFFGQCRISFHPFCALKDGRVLLQRQPGRPTAPMRYEIYCHNHEHVISSKGVIARVGGEAELLDHTQLTMSSRTPPSARKRPIPPAGLHDRNEGNRAKSTSQLKANKSTRSALADINFSPIIGTQLDNTPTGAAGNVLPSKRYSEQFCRVVVVVPCKF